MSASQPNILELAKQGDARAIAALMNRYLQPKGILAKTTLTDGSLHVRLESDQPLNQTALVEFVRKGVTNLGVDAIKTIQIYATKTDEPNPLWEQEIVLKPPVTPPVDETTRTGSEAAAPIVAATPVVTGLNGEGSGYSPALDQSSSYSDANYSDYSEEPAADGDVLNHDSPGLVDRLRRNWLVIPMMLVAALIGFGLVVFIGGRERQAPSVSPSPSPASPSPQSPPASPTPAAATPTPTPSPSATPTPSATPSPSPAASRSPAASPRVTPQPDYVRAMEVGYSAAVKTQTAETVAEWQTVVSEWEQAIALLRKVPQDAVIYARAQEKINEYERNLAYARSEVVKARSRASRPRPADR